MQLTAKKILGHLRWEHAAVIPDSGIALYPRGVFGKTFRNYGYCEAGILDPLLLPRCQEGTLEITDVVLDAAKAFPTVPFAYIFSKVSISVFLNNRHRSL